MEQTASSMSVNLSVTEKYNTNNLASNSSYQWSELEAGLLSTRSVIAATNVSPEEEGGPAQANLPIEVILNDQPFFLPGDAELFDLPFFNAKDDTLDTPPTTLNNPTPPNNK